MAAQPKILRATLARVDAVLAAIDAASGIDFPYKDSLDALNIVAAEFRDIRQTLVDSTNPAIAPAALKGYCARALDAIFGNLPLVGFLARSANANGAPELHGPMRRLTAKAIGKDAKLVISSEWDFSPFTLLYPHNALSEFVLVGLPMSESGNALVAPLAGHELGHNIWRHHKVLQRLVPLAQEKLRACIQGRWADFKKETALTDPKQLDDLIGQTFLADPFRRAVAQSEELFCDLVGLRLFGEGYLYAFEYLLAPGVSGERSTDYPRVQDRVNVLQNSATAWGISSPTAFAESFEPQDMGSLFLQSFADETALALVPDLMKCAGELTAPLALVKHTDQDMEKLAARFRALVPATGARHLGWLINAGWRVYFSEVAGPGTSNSPLSKLKDEDRARVLNELLLKSFEVFEIEELQSK
nr:hypothetical protein Hi04_10k_c4921_00026 [uncultured bacterium]